MRTVSLSLKAEADIDEIAAYTTKAWGLRQTDRYLAQLEDSLQLLASNPLSGRRCDTVAPGLRRFEVGKHVVFYMETANEILVVRVLHQQMLPTETRFET